SRLQIHSDQAFELLSRLIAQAPFHLAYLNQVRERLLQSPDHHFTIGAFTQLFPEVSLQTFEQFNIRGRIQASHPPPIPRQPHLRVVLFFKKKSAYDIDELALHHVRHIPQQEEL